MNKIIYFDHAATTYTDPEVIKAMEPFFTERFFNPSSLYTPAREAAKQVAHARKTIAKCINAASESEIIFTGCGSESDNMAVMGIAWACKDKGRHIITSAIEHPAVLNTVKGLERFGFDYSIIPVDKYGVLDLEVLKKSLREDTTLISVMYANNEVGTIQPVKEIGDIARERGIFFHTDAVQAAGSLPIDVQASGIDALSIAAHKFYGPKGVGALYIRKKVPYDAIFRGGHQEYGKRPGTHNSPGIIGMAKALEIACRDMEENNNRIIPLRDKLIEGVLKNIPHTVLNGHPVNRLPNNANFSFEFVDSEAVLLHLDSQGICASSGSACSSGSEAPSHVLDALGIPPHIARGSIRMSLGKGTTQDEIDFVLERLPKILESLRKMSPLA